MKHPFQISESIRLGILLAEIIHVRQLSLLHWRQTAVLLEVLILISVSFFPSSLNLPANALISFLSSRSWGRKLYSCAPHFSLQRF